jgi:hypothetical protein
MLRLEMLAAAQGDALWIEYGDEQRPRRIVVDGGTKASWPAGLRARIEALPAEERAFELLVITHVDADHIDGALALLRDEELGATFEDVWFNGWRHLPDTDIESLGPVEGELVTDTLVARRLPWNGAFDGGAVVVGDNGLPHADLAGGLRITLLSPYAQQLAQLKPVWRRVIEEAGLDPDKPRAELEPEPASADVDHLGAARLPDVTELAAVPFKADTAEANGSSIAFLLEHDGKRMMLCGDAFPGVVLNSVERLAAEGTANKVSVDAFKLPHHGSHANISLPLLEKLDCPRFLFSSNGEHTRHPHPEAVARVLVADEGTRSLLFNYTTRYNEVWAEQALRTEQRYDAVYPGDGLTGLAVAL